MSRRRDRASAEGLLPLMEARPWRDGKTVTYRYHPLGGNPINLGTDRDAAILAVLQLNRRAPDSGTFREMWRLYLQSPDWAALAPGTQTDYRLCWFSRASIQRIQRLKCGQVGEESPTEAGCCAGHNCTFTPPRFCA